MKKSIDNLLLYSKKLNLLYLEDESSSGKTVEELLKKLFNTVYLANNPQDALALFNKHHIDIVITNTSGLEIAHSIRKGALEIPIIVMAAHVDHDFFVQSIEMGIDAYLLKPIDHRQLIYTLHKIVKNIVAMKSVDEDSHYFRVLTEASIVSKSDINGIITYVNDNLCKISGYTREELIGKSHNIFRHPDNPTEMYTKMWETILAGHVWRGRVENLNKNGDSFLADSIIIPLKDNRGEILEFIAIRQDVTEHVMLERKMKSDMLKKEEEKRINEAKEAFLVLFTHELKTPLNAIINFSKYLYTRLVNSQNLEPLKTMKLLKSIMLNANDMLDNVNNILDISKLQSHKLNYNKRLFSINKLINDLLEQFDSLLMTKKIKVDVLMSEEIEVYSDEYRVKQVISNILSNAIKYGDNKISIEVKKRETGVEIYIDDNGKGIVDKKSVFDLYEQGNSSLIKRETQGTGIGLYFLKLICLDLGIRYRLEDSKRLGGTRFVLMFDIKNKRVE